MITSNRPLRSVTALITSTRRATHLMLLERVMARGSVLAPAGDVTWSERTLKPNASFTSGTNSVDSHLIIAGR